MSTPTKDTVNAAAKAAQIALKDAANTAFITAADIVIAEMVAQGKFKVAKLPVLKPASMSDLATYYRGLGYGVCFDECSSWNGTEGGWGQEPWTYPFGAFFPSFYSFFFICNCKQQCTMSISWR